MKNFNIFSILVSDAKTFKQLKDREYKLARRINKYLITTTGTPNIYLNKDSEKLVCILNAKKKSIKTDDVNT